ncbi:hypothetical protein BMS3Abin10_01278 [bacterium BMS3Abin10]|nr:hypothetical protein BMS3Abin10_01278 [bacterium BMS3Abin10]
MKRLIKDLRTGGVLSMATFMDKLLFFLLVALAIAGFSFMDDLLPAGNLVNISVDDTTVYKLYLDEDRVVSVKGPLGDNIIEIKDGKIRMKDAPCPQKLCVRQGWVDRGAIVCLPNRVVVSVGGDKQHSHAGDFDAVTK